MTCGNPRCQHEFCWLCLHDWTRATHDASFCTCRAKASHSEVLLSVERQIRSKRSQQAHDTRPAEDTYAKEVFQHSRVALTTCLESDAELLSAEDADGSTQNLLNVKRSNSIKQDRPQSSFTTHSQLLVKTIG